MVGGMSLNLANIYGGASFDGYGFAFMRISFESTRKGFLFSETKVRSAIGVVVSSRKSWFKKEYEYREISIVLSILYFRKVVKFIIGKKPPETIGWCDCCGKQIYIGDAYDKDEESGVITCQTDYCY